MDEEIKGVLIVETESSLSMEGAARVKEKLVQFCDEIGFKGLLLSDGMKAKISYDLKPLISMLENVVDVLGRTIESNQMLIEALATMGDENDDEPTTYLDGSKI